MMSQESILRLGEWSSSCHLPAMSQRNSSRYNLVSEALTCPSIALADPENRSRLSRSSLAV